MPKSRSKIKKTMITTSTTLVGICDEFDLTKCCSNRNCPSHWHNRLTEKLKTIQQTKLKTSESIESKHQYQLLYSDILLKLFQINEFDENNQEIYSKPISKSILLNKHNIFFNQISKRLNNMTYTFIPNNLNVQMNYRMIPLIFNHIDRMKISTPLKINRLRINHIHKNFHLAVKIISIPIWNHSAIHVIIQDENTHCLRLSIYNWSYVVNSRQIKSLNYIQERLKYLLPINSSIILLDPWLKKCQDGDVSLRCDSPNTNLIHINNQIDVEQLRQLGNICYQADDNFSAIEFYSFALKQLSEQQEKELTLKGQSSMWDVDRRKIRHKVLTIVFGTIYDDIKNSSVLFEDESIKEELKF